MNINNAIEFINQHKKVRNDNIAHNMDELVLFRLYNTVTSTSHDSHKLQNQNVEQIIDFGFSKNMAMSALLQSDNDVNKAVNRLYEGAVYEECFGTIIECPDLIKLKNALEMYDQNKMDDIDIVSTLNAFHHLLLEHVKYGKDFEFAYDYLGKKCDINHCKSTKRNYRKRGIVNRNYKEIATMYCSNEEKSQDIGKTILLKQFLDTIHCYFKHSYDIGLRLTKREMKQVQSAYKSDDEKEMKNDGRNKYNKNQKLLKTYQILHQKHKIFKNIADNDDMNKFNQLNRSKPNKDQLPKPNITRAHTSKINKYSYGRKYYYWKHFKNSTLSDDIANFGYQQRDWYIEPKYESIKEELTENKVVAMTIEQFKAQYKKAALLSTTITAKKQKATFVQQYAYCEISKNSPITTNHLLAVSVYCGFSGISREFSASFRNYEDETDYELKMRHSCFYYLSKFIHEAIKIFCIVRGFNKHLFQFFHGIAENMVFDSMCDYIYHPFSTTSSFEAAVNFTNSGDGNYGIVLEVNPDLNERFFDCSWVSEFPNEHELLFISMEQPMAVVNVTHASNGLNYGKYIKAMVIIDSMMQQSFVRNPDYKVLNQWKERGFNVAIDPLFLGADVIDELSKYFVMKFLKTELKMETYGGKFPEYISELFHYICCKKRLVLIDVETMSVNISQKYYHTSGYNGYLFLKDFFFENNSDIIKLQRIHKLYPNVKYIQIEKLCVISSEYVDVIYNYLSKNHEWSVKIALVCKSEVNFDGKALYYQYKQSFELIGRRIIFGENGLLVQNNVDAND